MITTAGRAMTEILSGFSALHRLASQFGDGLKPELAELLDRDAQLAQRDVHSLAAPQKSAGPKHQFATNDELEEAGIPVLRAARETKTAEKKAIR
jgi:hypothetical protein